MQAHTARSASMEISMIPAVCSRLCDVDFSSSSSCRIRFASVLSIVEQTSRSARVLQDPHLFYLKAAEGQPQVPPVCADPHRAQFLRKTRPRAPAAPKRGELEPRFACFSSWAGLLADDSNRQQIYTRWCSNAIRLLRLLLGIAQSTIGRPHQYPDVPAR